MVFNELQTGSNRIVDPLDVTRQRKMESDLQSEDLLVPCVAAGKLLGDLESLETIRDRVKSELEKFHRGITRLDNPHRYPVGLEASLHELKSQLVLAARGIDDGETS